MSHHWHENVGIAWCPCDEDQDAPGAVTAVPPRPAAGDPDCRQCRRLPPLEYPAPDATAGDGLRSAQRRLADELDRHGSNIGARDSATPDVWFVWCNCGWDGGRFGEDYADRYRMHIADAVLALPALRDVLAAAARDAEAVARVREEHANDGYGQCLGCQRECYMCQSVHEWPCPTVDALNGSQ